MIHQMTQRMSPRTINEISNEMSAGISIPPQEPRIMTFDDLSKMFHFLKYLVPALITAWVVTMAILARKGVIR